MTFKEGLVKPIEAKACFAKQAHRLSGNRRYSASLTTKPFTLLVASQAGPASDDGRESQI